MAILFPLPSIENQGLYGRQRVRFRDRAVRNRNQNRLLRRHERIRSARRPHFRVGRCRYSPATVPVRCFLCKHCATTSAGNRLLEEETAGILNVGSLQDPTALNRADLWRASQNEGERTMKYLRLGGFSIIEAADLNEVVQLVAGRRARAQKERSKLGQSRRSMISDSSLDQISPDAAVLTNPLGRVVVNP